MLEAIFELENPNEVVYIKGQFRDLISGSFPLFPNAVLFHAEKVDIGSIPISANKTHAPFGVYYEYNIPAEKAKIAHESNYFDSFEGKTGSHRSSIDNAEYAVGVRNQNGEMRIFYLAI